MKGFIRVALYARVSSQKQAEEMTIESQLASIRDRAQRDGFVIDSSFEFADRGFTGSELQRPALERLRDALAAGMIDRVYIHSPDRLARRLAHQAILLEEFAKCNCEVVFLNQEGIPNTPEASLLIQLQGMIAEYEREKILERTRRGRRYAAKQGRLSALAGAPFGYRYVPKQPGGTDAKWIIDELQAPIVKLIFELVAIHGRSLSQVQRELHKRGIRTSTDNEYWDRATLRGILINPAYQGTAKFGKYRLSPRKVGRRSPRGAPVIPRRTKVPIRTSPEEQETISVPPIVHPSLFQAAGERMEENRRRQRERQGTPAYLLSGLVLCGCCQSAYCGHGCNQGRYRYYCCLGADKSRRPNHPLCDNPSVRAEALEDRAWEELCHILRDPDCLKQELRRRRDEDTQQPQKFLERERRVNALRTQLDRLIDAHVGGIIEHAEFESRITSLRSNYHQELAALENLRGIARGAEEESWVIDSLNQLSAQVTLGLSNADFNLKRELLKLLVSRIEIHREEVRIVYKVPFRPFVQSPDKRGILRHCLHHP